MITKEQALTCNEFHENGCTRDADGPRGGRGKEHILRWRRNGKTQTWKTRPEDFCVPLKRGLKEHARLTSGLASQVHVAERCPLTVKWYALNGAEVSLCDDHGLADMEGKEASWEEVNLDTGEVFQVYADCVICERELNVANMAQAVLVDEWKGKVA